MKLSCTTLIFSIACGLGIACSPAQLTAHLQTERDSARRTEVEKLMLEGKFLHDGALELEHIGNLNSVPALLVVLKENPPKANGMMICTTAHALGALKKITGADAGITYESWNAWWEDHKAKTAASGQ